MNFVSSLHTRLTETSSFVAVLKTQANQLTEAYGLTVDDSQVDNWFGNCSRVIAAAADIQKQLLDKCIHGTTSTEILDLIQKVCESLGRMWFELRTQLTNVSNVFVNRDDAHRLKEEIETQLGELFKRTWIVTRQPPQVLKTNTRFSATLRCLTGDLITSAYLELVKVRAAILSETQARMLTAYHSSTKPQTRALVNTIASSGALSNRETVLLRSGNEIFEAKFIGMVVKKISRSEKKGTISVMEEKFGISFTSEVKCVDGELVYHIQVLSLPIVVVVHINQEMAARATAIWDYHFASSIRLPFEVPDKVPWVKFGQMLSRSFTLGCECELDQEDLNFLAAKVLRATTTLDYNSLDVTWTQFAKEPLPGLTFTFWEWFASIQKLVRELLKDYWTSSKRLIKGFINRSDCEKELIGRPSGTFLLRFSETALGCLSIAYTVTDRFNQQVLLNLAPFSLRDLSIRSLPDRISDIQHLIYLYPDIPKDNAFGSFYKPIEQTAPMPKGYVKSVLVTQVPDWTYSNPPLSGLHPIEPVSLVPSNQFFQSPINSVCADSSTESLSNSVFTDSSADNYSHTSSQSPETYLDNDLDRMINDINFYSSSLSPSTSQMAEFISGFDCGF